MHLIDGKTLAETQRNALRTLLEQSAVKPRLAVLLVGDDPASALYVKLKKKAAEEIGIQVDVTHESGATTTEALVALVKRWNADKAIHGILVQLPLPVQFDEQNVIDAMDPKKDADGFHPENLEALARGEATIIPPVHEGILRLISQTPIRINGAHAVIIGKSDIFTKPLERLLKTGGATVTRLHPEDLAREEVKTADIVVSAVGAPNLIKPLHVKDGAVLIDVGTTKLENNRIAGDIDSAAFHETECWITPVPGGVGPMTIAQLLWNVYRLAK